MAEKQVKRPQPKKMGTGFKSTIYMFVIGGIMIAALPTATLMAVGMVPTIVALIVDVTPGRFLTRCVAGLNIAGISPFAHALWTGANDMTTAVALVTDAFVWLVIYGASAIGWMLFISFPGVVAVFQSLNGRRRIYMLEEKQKQLLEEWGDSIRSPGDVVRSGSSGGSDAATPASRAAAG